MSKLNFGLLSKYRGVIMGIATITVLLFHFAQQREFDGYAYNLFFRYLNKYISSSGVDLFLIVSGIGLYFSFKKNSNEKQFFIRRFTKILVPYITICVVASIFNDFILNNNPVLQTILNLTYVNMFAYGECWFWYIFCILLFYLMFPYIYKVFDTAKDDIDKDMRMIILFTFIMVLNICLKQYSSALYSNINKLTLRLPIFIFGVYLGDAVYNKKPVKLSHIFILIFNLFTIFILKWPNKGTIITRITLTALNFSLVCFGIIFLELFSNKFKRIYNFIFKFLNLVGRYSLEIYLLQVIFIRWFRENGLPVSRTINEIYITIIIIILSVGYQFINNNISDKITPYLEKIFNKKQLTEK